MNFNIVCLSLYLHQRVFHPHLANDTLCTYSGKNDTNPFHLHKTLPQAVKSYALKPLDKRSTMIFTTAKNKKEAKQITQKLQGEGYLVGYVQDLQTLSEVKLKGVVEAHAKVFRLPPHEAAMMGEYMEVWDKLRMCCGVEMSTYWRNELLAPEKQNNTSRHHSICSSLNIDTVEQQLMNTTLFRMLKRLPHLSKINQPSYKDGRLDGKYCSSYNRLVKKENITSR